jgi:hypothetical protein
MRGNLLGSSTSTALRAEYEYEYEGAVGWNLATGTSPLGSTESRPTGDGGRGHPPQPEPTGKGLATGLGPGAK